MQEQTKILYSCEECGTAIVAGPRKDFTHHTCQACGHHDCHGVTFVQHGDISRLGEL